ncbi:MAG: tyrosine-type recombinase/integrase [Bacteroidota bacterium]
MPRPIIHLRPIQHRGSTQIKLDFPFDVGIKAHIKKLAEVRYSRTHNCFYMAHDFGTIGKLMAHCKPVGIWVEAATLRKSDGAKANVMEAAETIKGTKVSPEDESGAVQDRTRIVLPDAAAWLAGHDDPYIPQRAVKQQTPNDNGIAPKNASPKSGRATKMEPQLARSSTRTVFPEALEARLTTYRAFLEQRRYAYTTIKTYLSLVRQFFAAHPDRAWNAFSRRDIEAYNHSAFIVRGKSYSTQNQFINAIKLFYKVHDIEGLVPDDIERPRKGKQLPEVLTKEEVRQLLSGVGNLKHLTLLSLVYACGLRIGEALALRPADLRLNERLLYVRGAKGRKDRRVPLAGKIVELLQQYQKAYPVKSLLFEGQKGGPYSYTSARKVMRRAVAKAGLSGKVSLHTLRHSYATHLLQSGTDLRYIQEILGHADPKTTMLYTHVAANDLKNIKSPFDELGL